MVTFSPKDAFAHEAIDSFETRMEIREDSSVFLKETIVYNFDENERHGIFRTVPKEFTDTQGVVHSLTISLLTVTDEKGDVYTWDDESDSDEFHIRIGDPNTTIHGIHTYVITYIINDAISFLDDRDELYWNVTGNGWAVPIENVRTLIKLPAVVDQKDVFVSCYRGRKGDKTSCAESHKVVFDEVQAGIGSVSFADTSLSPQQGLTVAVGFPKGLVTEREKTLREKIHAWLRMHKKTIDGTLAVLIPLGVTSFWFRHWYRKGRDPKGRTVIVPEYDSPKNLSVLEAALIMRSQIQPKDISAAIIELAIKGALRIEKGTKSVLLVFKKTDYSLVKLEPSTPLSMSEKALHERLFSEEVGAKDGVLHMDDVVATAMQLRIQETKKVVGDEVVSKKYFTKNPFESVGLLLIISLVPVIVLFIFISLWIVPLTLAWFGIMTSFIIAIVFATLMPQKTKEGTSLRDSLLGLKMYIGVAEKDRIEFHNAPEKTPELFEKLLPYAMIFGLTDIWVAEFKDVVKEPLGWYSGSGNAWALSTLGTDLNTFSSSFASSSTPSSSGGGSSGGGGGGGGGGSW